MNSSIESPVLDKDSPSDKPSGLVLDRIPGTFGICRLDSRARIPRWVHRSIFYTVSRSPNELSILCEERVIPKTLKSDLGWSALKIAGTLDLSLIGVLASLAGPLAEARIGLFTVSTFDTDYLLVREKRLDDAIAVLERAGHTFDLRLLEAPGAQAADPKPAEQKPTDQASDVHKPADPKARRTGSTPSAPPSAASPSAVSPSAVSPSETSSVDEPSIEASVADSPSTASPVEPEAVDPEVVEPRAETPTPRKRGGAFGRVLGDRREPKPAAPERPDSEPRRPWYAPKSSEPAREEVAEPELANHESRRSESSRDASVASESAVSESAANEAAVPRPTRDSTAEDVEPRQEVIAKTAAEPQAAVGDSEAEGLLNRAIPQHPVELTDKSFADLGLSPLVLKTVSEVGFENPTPIQVQVIPLALEGHDVVGLAETGSGKTAAFSLPMAERLHHGRGTRGLILCPTREIALQTKAFLDIFGRDHQLETVAVIGGVRMGPQIDGFRRDADILVATPGRLADHMRRRNVRLDKIEKLVLDEADHMLDLGFLPQIKEILEQVPDNRQTLMFSATMPPPIERLAQIFMRDPLRCDIRPSGQIAAGIEHRLYLVKDEDRKNCLFALLREVEGSTLIFVRRKLYTEWLARQIELAGFGVARIHSDRTQSQRVEALKSFREGRVRILVATDVAARGIDVPLIQHVINYGLPEQTEDYVHRAGRTARGSAAGVVSTIGTWQDKMTVREIELDLGITMPRCETEGVDAYVELPKRKQVRRRRLL